MFAGFPPGPAPLEPEPELHRLTAEEGIYAWRLLQILSAGADLEDAIKLALSKSDLHTVCDSLAAGCKPSLAVLIFA